MYTHIYIHTDKQIDTRICTYTHIHTCTVNKIYIYRNILIYMYTYI